MNPASSPKSNHLQTASPSEDGVYQAELSNSSTGSASAKPPQRSAAARITLILLFFVGVAAPAIWFWLPSEQANWRVAAAQAKWFEDDKASAMQILDAAVIEFPDSIAIYAQRLDFLLATEQFDKALADAERLVELSPKTPGVLGMKSQVLHHLGRHEDAMVVGKEVLRLAEEEWLGARDTALNQLAYAQALTGKELDDAREAMDEVLRLHGNQTDFLLQKEEPFTVAEHRLAESTAAYLDTYGFVMYKRGDFKAARESFEQSVAVFQRHVEEKRAGARGSVDSFNVQRLLRHNDQTLAILLYHRSLAFDRVGMQVQAKIDRELVRNLGYEPNDKLF